MLGISVEKNAWQFGRKNDWQLGRKKCLVISSIEYEESTKEALLGTLLGALLGAFLGISGTCWEPLGASGWLWVRLGTFWGFLTTFLIELQL